MDWGSLWSRITGAPRRASGHDYSTELTDVNRRRSQFQPHTDEELRILAAAPGLDRVQSFALTCEAARRTLGLDLSMSRSSEA